MTIHGGDLEAARRLFPDAPEPFIDLSTGINPEPYPLPFLEPAAFARLPEPGALGRLLEAAALYYGAPTSAYIAAGPGTHGFLACLAAGGSVRILGPTYAEHARIARTLGLQVAEVETVEALAGADLAVVVNPNNPDGRLLRREALVSLAGEVGLLVVDEAFMDAAGDAAGDTAGESCVGCDRIVVLRSFGKFFGLAGIRLGFAITAPARAERLRALMGPWPVSGPALAIATAAFADPAWTLSTRRRLAADADRLDRLLGGTVGTPLFRLVRSPTAGALFTRLGQAGLWTRRFDEHPALLRIGLPRADQWDRLTAALGPRSPAD